MSGSKFDILVQKSPPKGWDEWLISGHSSGFCQTTMRASMYTTLNGGTPFYVRLVGADKLIAAQALLILVEKNVALPCRFVKMFFPHLFRKFICHEGPALEVMASSILVSSLIQTVCKLAKEKKAGRIEVMPFVSPEHFVIAPEAWQAEGFSLRPWKTSVVNLNRTETEMFDSFHHSIRKGIRKCEKSGVTVYLCQDWNDVRENFIKPYYQTKDQPGDVLSDKRLEQFHQWWLADTQKNYAFFAARDETNAVLATLGTYRFNRVATEIMSARTARGHELGAPVQDLIHWQAFLHHKNKGDKHFNMAGYSPEPQSEKEFGIRRYKQKWGGAEYDMPTYVFYSPFIKFGLRMKNIFRSSKSS